MRFSLEFVFYCGKDDELMTYKTIVEWMDIFGKIVIIFLSAQIKYKFMEQNIMIFPFHQQDRMMWGGKPLRY